MCGRYELNETPANLGSRYRIEPGDLDFAPNADVCPTTTNPVVLVRDGARRIELPPLGVRALMGQGPEGDQQPFQRGE